MSRSTLRAILVVLLSLGTAVFGASADAQEGETGESEVSIVGTQFFVDDEVTYPGTPAEGLLLNSRTVQAVFDDENPKTVKRWAYSDTGVWDPSRNTDEFIAALPSYADAGLSAVTIGMQGGSAGTTSSNPDLRGPHQDPVTSAFSPDGTLKPAWVERLDRVIRAASANRMVVILNLFYFGQTHRWANEAAVLTALDNTVDWLVAQGYGNVILDLVNESSNPGSSFYAEQPILQRHRVHTLVERAKTRSGGVLLVGTSVSPGAVPPDELITASDFVLLHGNNRTAAEITAMVKDVRSRPAFAADPKPVVFNEDSPKLANMDAAVRAGAGWGFHHKASLQIPPVNWAISTPEERAFFERVSTYSSPRLVADPASLAFTFEPGSGAASQAVALDVSAGAPVAVSVSDDQEWLIASAEAAATPTTVNVSVDPAGLAPGSYQGQVRVEADGAEEVLIAVTVRVGSVPPPEPQEGLLLSASRLREDPQPLDGSTVSGAIYVFFAQEPGIRSVLFRLDGRLIQRENHAPYDLGGSSRDRRTALPFDTRRLADGTHLLRAEILFRDGTEATTEAQFLVANSP